MLIEGLGSGGCAARIVEWMEAGKNGVLARSALRQVYRDQLRGKIRRCAFCRHLKLGERDSLSARLLPAPPATT